MIKTIEEYEDDYFNKIDWDETKLTFRQWLSSKLVHTKPNAIALVSMLNERLPKNVRVELIGSLSRDKNISLNDIDIHLIGYSNGFKNIFLKRILKDILKPESIENTDWDGWYFNKTKEFGNVDIFFDISKFDY